MQPENPHNEAITLNPSTGDRTALLAGIAPWDHPGSNWNRAAMHPAPVDPFCARTEWQLSFHEAMAPHRPLIVREVPGSVVALAEERHPGVGRIFMPVEAGWLFGCPLLGPDAVDLLEELLAEHEPAAGARAPVFVISGLAPEGELIRQLGSRLGPRFNSKHHVVATLCSASLDGGLDGFLSRRSARHRQNLRKQLRRATRAGVSFERHAPADAAEARQIYARMLAVEEQSWKGIGECGMTVGRSRRYYDCMMRRLAASASGRVIFARHAERDIGYIFGGLAGRVYRGQQFSYADDWATYSIGNLLQLEQIRWLCEEHMARYDMGPMMDYKRHWTEEQRVVETWVFQRRLLLGSTGAGH